MRFYFACFGFFASLISGLGTRALAAPTITPQYQLADQNGPVDHYTAEAHYPANWQVSKSEMTYHSEPNLSAQYDDEEAQDQVYPAPGNSIPEMAPQNQFEAVPQEDSGYQPYPTHPVDPKDRCLYAEYYVKYGTTAELVAYYRNYLETNCQETPVEEKCAWLKKKKDACQTAVLKTPQSFEPAVPLNDTPQWQPADKPKLESPSNDCNDYREWFEEICVANPPTPNTPDDGTGAITPGTFNYGLSGGGCSLSGAGTTADSGMALLIIGFAGLFTLKRKIQ